MNAVQLPFPPSNRTDTSVAAAIAVAPRSPSQRGRVLAYLEGFGPATQDEIAVALDLPRATVAPRVNELVKQGLVRDSGQRRKTRFGQTSAVYEVA